MSKQQTVLQQLKEWVESEYTHNGRIRLAVLLKKIEQRKIRK